MYGYMHMSSTMLLGHFHQQAEDLSKSAMELHHVDESSVCEVLRQLDWVPTVGENWCNTLEFVHISAEDRQLYECRVARLVRACHDHDMLEEELD